MIVVGPFQLELFCSVLFYSILFHSFPFHSIPFHSIPFHSIPFHSIQNQCLWKLLNRRKPESSHLTLQLTEAVASSETFATFPTGNAFSSGTSASIPSRACDSCALGCGHSGLEDLQAQGSHLLSRQPTLVLHDPHKDFGFDSLSPA